MRQIFKDALTMIGIMAGSIIICGLVLIAAVIGYGWLWHRVVGG